MSEAGGALLLGRLAKTKQQVPAMQPLCPRCSAEQGKHSQPTWGRRPWEPLSSLLCTGKQEACLCSSETAEEGAQCSTACAELCLVRDSLGGAVGVFGLALGEGLSALLALSELEWLSASLRHSLWSSFMFDRWTLYEVRKESLWGCSAQAPCLSHSVMSVCSTPLCFWWDHV